MRTYIFTAKERKAIRGFFEGSVSRDDSNLMTIIYRIKSFKDLATDVDLYARLREAVSTITT
jgi:hypothetical protein